MFLSQLFKIIWLNDYKKYVSIQMKIFYQFWRKKLWLCVLSELELAGAVWKDSNCVIISWGAAKQRLLSLLGSTQSMWTSRLPLWWLQNNGDLVKAQRRTMRWSDASTTIFVNPLLRATGALMDTSVCVSATIGQQNSRTRRRGSSGCYHRSREQINGSLLRATGASMDTFVSVSAKQSRGSES